jgi:RNA polymerase sigma-70 factor (ECF subfamily)
MHEISQDPDAALVQRLQAGDEPAFRELLTRWQRPILNFVYRMTGDATAAEDIAQEVFVRVFRRIGEFRLRPGRASFSTWLFQIARNAALDHLRQRARHPADRLDDLPDGGGGIAAREPAPDELAAHREVGAEIARAVMALPEDQRTALVLAQYEGASVAGIAAIMDSSEKSVESRLYRARQTLRQRLAHLLRGDG